jgi:hypothetical protein
MSDLFQSRAALVICTSAYNSALAAFRFIVSFPYIDWPKYMADREKMPNTHNFLMQEISFQAIGESETKILNKSMEFASEVSCVREEIPGAKLIRCKIFV